jgi:hypothetical protein
MASLWNNYSKGQLSFPLTYWGFGLGGNIAIYAIAFLTGAIGVYGGAYPEFYAASLLVAILFGALSFVGVYPFVLILALSSGADLTLGFIGFALIWGVYNFIWINALWTSGDNHEGRKGFVSLAKNQSLVLVFLSMIAIMGAFVNIIKAIL